MTKTTKVDLVEAKLEAFEYNLLIHWNDFLRVTL